MVEVENEIKISLQTCLGSQRAFHRRYHMQDCMLVRMWWMEFPESAYIGASTYGGHTIRISLIRPYANCHASHSRTTRSYVQL